MTGRCATCIFWSVSPAFSAGGPCGPDKDLPHHRCVRIIHELGLRYVTGDATPEADASTQAFLNDGSGYAAALHTLPTFGCTLWEQKP